MEIKQKLSMGRVFRLIVILTLLFIPLNILEKGVQYLVFLYIEKQQLKIVTADDFIMTEFGVDPDDRAKSVAISYYSRFIPNPTRALSKDINTSIAVAGFLETAPKPVSGDFLLYYLKPGRSGSGTVFLEYPVELCGQRYCEFDPNKGRLRDGVGKQDLSRYSVLRHEKIIGKFGFDFRIFYMLSVENDTQPKILNVFVGNEQRNALDRFLGKLGQTDPPYYWANRQIYERDFVTGWSFQRGDFGDG
ncbi:MAG: hypothetical protein JKY94_02410 [Rhodobacteraceae bacterium]|nr:hypothetical protein [Paracoccaceae bacterium]